VAGVSWPPRSILYVPASRGALLEKIPASSADAVIVDLEDGVPPQDKDAARDHVRAAVASGSLSPERPWMLRINAGRSGPIQEDLVLVGFAKPPWVVLPKAEDPAAVATLAARFAEHGAATALMIETATGVVEARVLAGVHPLVRMLIVGSADLRLSLQARPDDDRAWERHALAEVLLAARRHGAAAIDSVYFQCTDDAGLRRRASIARELGYDGKTCIHSRQVAPIHDVYRSSPDEVAWARRVVEAWAMHCGAVKGVVAMDGEMIEALHVTLAERILARS
jgi:citrate lyase subunit beta/citryl-CoA lyase